jgi:hypothetical protein
VSSRHGADPSINESRTTGGVPSPSSFRRISNLVGSRNGSCIAAKAFSNCELLEYRKGRFDICGRFAQAPQRCYTSPRPLLASHIAVAVRRWESMDSVFLTGVSGKSEV